MIQGTRWFGVALGLIVPMVAEAQIRRSDIQAGAHVGFDFTNGGIEDERIGVQGVVPVLGPVEFSAVVGYLYNFPDDPSGQFSGSAWQGFFGARIRPFGRGSFAALGFGLMWVRATVSDQAIGVSISDSDVTDAFDITLELPTGRIRPFGTLYLLSALEEWSVGGNALFGINVSLR